MEKQIDKKNKLFVLVLVLIIASSVIVSIKYLLPILNFLDYLDGFDKEIIEKRNCTKTGSIYWFDTNTYVIQTMLLWEKTAEKQETNYTWFANYYSCLNFDDDGTFKTVEGVMLTKTKYEYIFDDSGKNMKPPIFFIECYDGGWAHMSIHSSTKTEFEDYEKNLYVSAVANCLYEAPKITIKHPNMSETEIVETTNYTTAKETII